MSITTKTGDDGSTGLMYGRRVTKTNPRVECYGTVDELNAALGMARASTGDESLRNIILEIQRELVGVMGELAVADEDRERYAKDGYACTTEPMVVRLTTLIHDIEKEGRLDFRGWATPGATMDAAALDMARTICRRAERHAVAIEEAGGTVNGEVKRYLNRLSDLCWLLARRVETAAAG